MIQTQYDKMAAYILRKDGEIKAGVADVTLPKISYMTDTISGAGLAGEIETPTMGQLSSMEFGINWRTINKDLLKLAAPNFHSLEFRGAQQVLDSEHEELKIQSVRIVVRGLPKETDLGKGFEWLFNIKLGDYYQKHEDVIKRKSTKLTEFLNGLTALIRKEHENKGYR
jgi:phage tail tube protein FII